MNKLIKLLAPFGVVGMVFIVALTSAMAAGLVVVVALAAGMAALGPGGMVGGLILLVVVGIIAKLAIDYGYDRFAIAIVKEYLKTKSKDEMWCEISKKKLVLNHIKLKIKGYIDRA